MPRIQQTSKFGINPCPVATDEQVLKLAEVPRVRRPNTSRRSQPFCVHFPFSGGHERESFLVDPIAEPLQLRGEGEWTAFNQMCEEQGCALVVDPENEDQLVDAKIAGLRRAIIFWTDRGIERAYDTQLRQGWNEDQFARQRGNLWPYYFNQILADICEAELSRLENGGDPFVNGVVVLDDEGGFTIEEPKDGESPTSVE